MLDKNKRIIHKFERNMINNSLETWLELKKQVIDKVTDAMDKNIEKFVASDLMMAWEKDRKDIKSKGIKVKVGIDIDVEEEKRKQLLKKARDEQIKTMKTDPVLQELLQEVKNLDKKEKGK